MFDMNKNKKSSFKLKSRLSYMSHKSRWADETNKQQIVSQNPEFLIAI